MNRKIVALAISIILPATLTAQRQEQKATLTIASVKVHLGLSKAEVRNKFSNFNILKIDDDWWSITQGKGANFESYGDLRFTKGLLTSASRDWYRSGDVTEAILAAVDSLNQEGFQVCRVIHDTIPKPDVSIERVDLQCGEKSLIIAKEITKETKFDVVVESLEVCGQRSDSRIANPFSPSRSA